MCYKYLTLIVGLFTATLVITNLLNTKLFMLFGFAFPAGILTFPLAFLVADILTEVYGYSATRRVIWTGFASLILMAVATLVADSMRPAPFWPHQEAFSALLRQVPRIVAASMLAYRAGEFTNSYVLARSKVVLRATQALREQACPCASSRERSPARPWTRSFHDDRVPRRVSTRFDVHLSLSAGPSRSSGRSSLSQ